MHDLPTPTPPTRRELLAYGLRGAFLLSASQLAGLARAQGARGYELLDVLPFAGDSRAGIGELTGEGLHGRRAFDVSTLTSKNLIVPNDRFFVRTRHPEHVDLTRPWKVRIDGLASGAVGIDAANLRAASEPLGVHLLECSGSTRNSSFGLIGAADWRGVPIPKILAPLEPRPGATRILVSGVDPQVGPNPGASWIFAREDLSDAALVTGMNGVPLPKDHGYPARLIVPGWYGCCWIKWVDRIAFVPDDAPATAQMREYASRTHQRGVLPLARDYAPATIDPAAMPVRVEQWRQGEKLFYRVVGIVWGGARRPPALRIAFGEQGDLVPVERYAPHTHRTWTLWSHVWNPPAPGRYPIRLAFADPDLRTRRMDRGYYDRAVIIREA